MADLLGHQTPRLILAPEQHTTGVDDAVKIARAGGLRLDAAQCFALHHALGELEDGQWSAKTVALLESRQNGKTTLMMARALLGLFVLGERIIWSAHQFKTTMAAFEELKAIINSTPAFQKRIKSIRTSNGSESIVTKDGASIHFIARSKNSGRGLTADLLLCDEAQELGSLAMAALMPMMSARPNPQLWLCGTVPGPLNNDSSVWTATRDAGRAGEATDLLWLEWSAGEDVSDLDDPERWAMANPALGTRITLDFIRQERVALTDEDFARERLSIWPSGSNAGLFGPAWADCIDAKSEIASGLTLGVAVALDRSYATIGASGTNGEGLVHLEPIDRRRGTSWVVERVVELHAKHGKPRVVIDSRGPAASLIKPLEDAGVKVAAANTQDVTDACAQMFDLVLERRVRHLADPDLDDAVMGASKRLVGDRWAIGRKNSVTDVSPLEAVVLAAWGIHLTATYDLLQSVY